MADDGHEEQAVAVAPPPPAELPEIKLFGRWSCDDVQISDMSLQVGYVSTALFAAGYYPCCEALPSTDESLLLHYLMKLALNHEC